MFNFACVYVMLLPPLASAVRSDCVRRPIRLRPPSDRIAFGVRSDCVRCTIRLRSVSDEKSMPETS